MTARLTGRRNARRPPLTPNTWRLQVGGDFTDLIGDNPDQANDLFSYNVVPGQALPAAALKAGMTLTTKSGEKLTVTVKRCASEGRGAAPLPHAAACAGVVLLHGFC